MLKGFYNIKAARKMLVKLAIGWKIKKIENIRAENQLVEIEKAKCREKSSVVWFNSRMQNKKGLKREKF